MSSTAESHRFKIGQAVRYTPAARFGRVAPNSFQVVALLPSNGARLQYRIRSKSEPFERVATENELLEINLEI